MMALADERWGLGSTLASAMFVWMAVRQYFPTEFADRYLRRWASKLASYVSPYVQISFPEFVGERLQRSEAFAAITPAGMANFLEYDVYDLELTAVKDNSALRRLLIETTSKSIIVIEDIDCSLDLTGKRRREGEKSGGAGEEDEKKKMEAAAAGAGGDDSKVTLSGLLNFIDGLWSACGGERLIVFTTNHVEKLDAALIRRGRMDKHIELSYCRFEAFKVLAGNYLGVGSHPRFDAVGELMEVADITPADVAELLIPRTRRGGDEEVDACLDAVVAALQAAKAKKEAAAAAEPGAAAKEEEEEVSKDKSRGQSQGTETE